MSIFNAILVWLLPAVAMAEGAVSRNLMSVFVGVNSVFSGVAIAIGIGLVTGAYIQYREHRRNNLQVPISQPIFLLILGLILIAIPLLGSLTSGGDIANHGFN